jgi:homoaconitase/3-isopropylmalate dehydratase large subunit
MFILLKDEARLAKYPCDGSVMITASHLPFNRNGLKFFSPDGGLEGADVKDILTKAYEGNFDTATARGAIVYAPYLDDYAKTLVQKVRAATGEEKPLLGKKIDYVFLGACTNGRIEDFRAFASIVKGRKKADDVVAWLVPGSWMVDTQIREEGLDKILEEAGFAIRQPGCSACLAMNDDKIPAGKYSVSTSNRNFEGRQGPGARTLLASPLTAAAAAVTGVITDPRELM